LTDKNIERIRAANRAMEQKYTSADKSHLIAELDDFVMNIIKTDGETSAEQTTHKTTYKDGGLGTLRILTPLQNLPQNITRSYNIAACS